jgi:hypothetical protein
MNALHSTENRSFHHNVKDYLTWRKGCDEGEESRLSARVRNGRASRGDDDVPLFQKWKSLSRQMK